MKLIRFLRQRGPYQEGETAGKPDTVAQELVDLGIAEYVNPPVAKVEPPPDEAKIEPSPEAPVEPQPTETKIEPEPDATKVEPPVKRRGAGAPA